MSVAFIPKASGSCPRPSNSLTTSEPRISVEPGGGAGRRYEAMGHRFAARTALMLAVVTAACDRPDPLGFTPVEGRVTLDGKPIESGEIRFVPDSGKGNRGPMSAGPLGKDGRFRLRGPGVRVGAIPGPHLAFLVSPDPTVAAGPMILIDGTLTMADGEARETDTGSAIPQRFLAPETSGMTAEVTPSTVNVVRFDLVSPAKPRKATAQ